jgi:hypothetical protein
MVWAPAVLRRGAIVQLVLRSKIAWTQQQLKGGYGPSYGTMAAASEADPAAGHWAAGGMAAAEAGSAGGEAEEAEVEDGLWVAAGRCSQLYASTPTRLASCRGHTHFFLELAKGAIAGGCSLVGWMWLTDPGAPPLLTSLWPLLLLLLGCYAMASAGISLYQAAVETTLQCYCEESRDLSQVAQQHQQQRAAAAKA